MITDGGRSLRRAQFRLQGQSQRLEERARICSTVPWACVPACRSFGGIENRHVWVSCTNGVSSTPPRTRRRLAPLTPSTDPLRLPIHPHGLLRRFLSFRLELRLRRSAALRAVPVVDHLRSYNGIEGEARDEAVKDELVRNFLQSGEDARQRSEEVVEDLREHHNNQLNVYAQG